MTRGTSTTARLLLATVAALPSACSPTSPDGLHARPTQFLVQGVVTEPVGVPVAGAVISALVISTGERVALRTSFEGTYRMLLPAGTAALEIAADGYAVASREVVINGAQTLDLEIVPLEAPKTVAGTWNIRFGASSACPESPVDTTREYQSVISQAGARLAVELSGAGLQGQRSFPGVVRGNHVLVHFGDWDHSGITEKISDSLFLSYWGDASGTLDNATTMGPFNGSIVIQDGDRSIWSCYGPDHQVRFDLSVPRR